MGSRKLGRQIEIRSFCAGFIEQQAPSQPSYFVSLPFYLHRKHKARHPGDQIRALISFNTPFPSRVRVSHRRQRCVTRSRRLGFRPRYTSNFPLQFPWYGMAFQQQPPPAYDKDGDSEQDILLREANQAGTLIFESLAQVRLTSRRYWILRQDWKCSSKGGEIRGGSKGSRRRCSDGGCTITDPKGQR